MPMPARSFRFRTQAWIRPLTLVAILIIWVLRRPDQLTSPSVWAEESFILSNFLQDGLLGAALTPVQGQLLLVTGLVEGLILSIFPRALPEFEYLAATLLMLGTVSLLLFPPSLLPLKLRILFAFGLVLVPVNPETFGVWLYSFWWIALWPLIILFWEPRKSLVGSPLLVISGLSSPAAGACFPLFIVRWYFTKKRSELISSLVLAISFLVQIAVLFASTRRQSEDLMPFESVRQMVEYPGDYLFAWLPETTQSFSLFVGALFFLLLFWTSLRPILRGKRDYRLLLLTFGLVIFAGLSALPEPVISEPNGAGPRYFFLPFVVISWILIYWLWSFQSLYTQLPRSLSVLAFLRSRLVSPAPMRLSAGEGNSSGYVSRLVGVPVGSEFILMVPSFPRGV